ncbi:twin-arginine translocase subunit TatC [bacterium]|nr:twin-arginine translocase subunit TatC [bacterium]
MKAKNDKKCTEFTEHLGELRTRLIRSAIYLVAGATLAWFLYDDIFRLLTRPMLPVIKNNNSKFLLTSFVEPFMLQMQVCIVSGVVVACPLIILEVWGFVSPGLTSKEKRPIKWVAPLSALLFVGGVTLCYLIMPMAFQWFANYIPTNAELRPNVQTSIVFLGKMLLVFGILFQLPIMLMVLSSVGIVSSRMLKDNWRTAVVIIAIVAALATPSNDALTMTVAAVPVAILYFLGILLVQITEKTKKNKLKKKK